MSEQLYGLAGDDRRGLRRLALYRPFDKNDKIESVCQELVLAAVHENDGKLSSCKDCQAQIHRLYGVQLELEEVFWAVRQLVKDGKLVESDQYRFLSETCHMQLTSRIRERNAIEAAAFEQWESLVSAMFPGLGTQQIGELRDDLITWIYRVVSDYGVETGVLCDKAHERYELYVAEVRLLSATILPVRDPFVMMIREDAVMAFFEAMTDEQLRYLDGLMASAHLMAVFTLDPNALGDVQRLANGQRLYLDTNLVYSVLTLNGPEKYLALRRVLNFSLRLGYQVCVTPWTVTEMEKSVRSARARLTRERPSPQDVAHLTPENETDEKYVSAYRRAQRDRGLSIKDFFELHENVTALLAEEGVDVVNESCAEIDADANLLDEEITRLERIPGGREKRRPLQVHDVKLKLLVKRLRGVEPRRFSNMTALVLTNDQAVMQFAERDREHTGDLPFAVSLAKWARTMRGLVPRTDDFDGSLAQMHEAPELRASALFGKKELLKAIEQIRSRGRLHPASMVRGLFDSALGISLSGDGGAGADNVTEPDDGLVIASLMQRIIELEAEVRQSQRRELVKGREADAQQEGSSSERSRVESELRDTRRQLHETQTRLERLSKRANAQPAVSPSRDRLASELAAVEGELSLLASNIKRKETIVRRAGGVILTGGGAACVTLAATGVVSGELPFLGTLGAGGAMLFAAVGWIYGKKRAATLASTIGFVLATLASLQTLFGKESPQPKPTIVTVRTGNVYKSKTGRRRANARGSGAHRSGAPKPGAHHRHA